MIHIFVMLLQLGGANDSLGGREFGYGSSFFLTGGSGSYRCLWEGIDGRLYWGTANFRLYGALGFVGFGQKLTMAPGQEQLSSGAARIGLALGYEKRFKYGWASGDCGWSWAHMDVARTADFTQSAYTADSLGIRYSGPVGWAWQESVSGNGPAAEIQLGLGGRVFGVGIKAEYWKGCNLGALVRMRLP